MILVLCVLVFFFFLKNSADSTIYAFVNLEPLHSEAATSSVSSNNDSPVAEITLDDAVSVDSKLPSSGERTHEQKVRLALRGNHDVAFHRKRTNFILKQVKII